MSVNEDWDVEQHKVEYESDEHWELRRKFLLAHKDKFTEDMLVCLAQVFVNIELLGCRYPQETMDLVKDLSQDVAAEYREKQKKKLQRTFVEASEAASSKVKGCAVNTSTVTEESIPNKLNSKSNIANHTDHTDHIDQAYKKNTKKRRRRIKRLEKLLRKKLFPNNNKTTIKPVCNEISHNQSCENRIETRSFKRLKAKEEQLSENPHIERSSKRLKIKEDQDHLFDRNFVLWERPDDNALNILESSASISGMTLKWNYSKIEEGWECSIDIDSEKLIGCSTNVNKKIARKEAATIALEKLQKRCYTIKVKQDLDTKSKVTVTTEEIKSQESLPDDDWTVSNCIGKKLMKIMGWTGGGLGKSEQGIVEPMSAIIKTQINRDGLGLKTQINRDGLSLKKNSYKTLEIKAKCRTLFKDLLQSNNYFENDIEFLDFSKEDRMLIHQIARTMGLKSRSHGKDQRKLIVSRKVNIWNLIRELNYLGGVTEKYELVKPTENYFLNFP